MSKAKQCAKLQSCLVAAKAYLTTPECLNQLLSSKAQQLTFFLQMEPIEKGDVEAMVDVLNECIDFLIIP